MLEKNIEKRLIDEVKKKKGLCLKFISPSMTGIPDRIVLLPNGRIGFVEVKGPGEKPRPIQLKRIKELKSLGCKVFVLDEIDQIDEVIKKIGGD
ncbi:MULTISPECIES: VRR-NUC domain-containing protein [Helcococcus]|uniref:VRR-NUC domain-containing protein n=1 Tax=Helcococcus bovis TaxID=3153252 RepID=A0ABW9F4V2_9FIRM